MMPEMVCEEAEKTLGGRMRRTVLFEMVEGPSAILGSAAVVQAMRMPGTGGLGERRKV